MKSKGCSRILFQVVPIFRMGRLGPKIAKILKCELRSEAFCWVSSRVSFQGQPLVGLYHTRIGGRWLVRLHCELNRFI